jgi:hypothetical protein
MKSGGKKRARLERTLSDYWHKNMFPPLPLRICCRQRWTFGETSMAFGSDSRDQPPGLGDPHSCKKNSKKKIVWLGSYGLYGDIPELF